MATQQIDILNNPANPANPTTEQLLELGPGGTVTFYGAKPGAALQLRVSSLKREGEHEGQFLIEGFLRLADGDDEVCLASSFYNARTGRGTFNVEPQFAARYQALADALPEVTFVPRPR